MKVRQHDFRLDHKGRALEHEKQPRPAKRNTYIIYVMRDSDEILYVGEGTRGVHRCWQGFRWDHKQLKYRWKGDKELRCATIECLVFGGFKPYGALKKSRVRKALEADVAAKIQALTGRWPCKLSRIDVYGSIPRKGLLAGFARRIIRTLQSRGWL